MIGAVFVGFSFAGLLGAIALVTEYSKQLEENLDRWMLRRKYRRICARYYELYREAEDDFAREYYFGVYRKYDTMLREVRDHADDRR